jgi:hydroxymethylpyrimidine/phosphomethylpyrimidine kinase
LGKDNVRSLLAIAATDSSGGAGLLADVQTFNRAGFYAQGVVSAVTAQNTKGISAVTPTPLPTFIAQLEAIFSDIPVAAVKIGLLPTADHIRAVAHFLRDCDLPIVVDPVLSATTGHSFHSEVSAYHQLFEICTIATPNGAEAKRLFADTQPTCATLVTGGDGEGVVCDTLTVPGKEPRTFTATRVAGVSPHGTGCLLSSLLTVALAEGKSLEIAVQAALVQTQHTIQIAPRLGDKANPAMGLTSRKFVQS